MNKTLLIILVLGLSYHAHGRDDLPKDRYVEFGLGANLGDYSVDDPSGQTGTAPATRSFSAILVYSGDRSQQSNWRIWSDISFKDFKLPYTKTQIGQSVQSLHLDTIAQRSMPLFWRFHGWLGGGIGMGINHIENRATRASDGFVKDNFPDRSETNLALIANASIVFAYSSNALVGVNLKHYTPTNNGIEGISLGGYVLFLY